MSSINSLELMWAVGLFEGEGCISLLKHNRDPEYRYKRVTLVLGMTDKDVVERFHRIVKVGRLRAKPRILPSHKDQWVWSTAKTQDVRYLLEVFLPHLGNRRKTKALEALAWLDSSQVSPRRHDVLGRFLPIEGLNSGR